MPEPAEEPRSRRELQIVVALVLVGIAVRIAYVLITSDHKLAGDEIEYDIQGRFFADGHPWWSTTPFGIAHATTWKAPGYPLWVGAWYALLGPDPDRLLIVQAVLSGATIVLTWMLGRRLFGSPTGLIAAGIVALYPLAWQYDVRLFPEGLATLLLLGVLLLVIERPPSLRRAGAVGAVVGIGVLVRPTSAFVLAAVLVCFVLAGGLRRGLALTAATTLVAVLVVAPWTYRNHRVDGGFTPVSVQDAALYGTFNDEAAGDPVSPYAWRPVPAGYGGIIKRHRPEHELRSDLLDRGYDYIAAHPASVPQAFFWNGLSRLWDVRRPSRALAEVPFEGRTRSLTIAGLAAYYVLLPLALLGLWMLRRRRTVVLPLLALAAAASIVFTVASGTRYRATLEPVIALMAAAAVASLYRRRRPEAQSGAGVTPDVAVRPSPRT